MKILILQGSPRANGNTAWMAEEYKKAAESAGHDVNNQTIDIAGRNPLMRQLDPIRDAEIIGKYSDSRWVLDW